MSISPQWGQGCHRRFHRSWHRASRRRARCRIRGEFDAGSNFTVTEGLFLGGIEAGGGVLIRTVLVSFMDCFDDELPVFDVGVFFVIGVALPLLVEASGGFDLSVPVGEVEMGVSNSSDQTSFQFLVGVDI